jgi:hypothetical protein
MDLASPTLLRKTAPTGGGNENHDHARARHHLAYSKGHKSDCRRNG